MAENDSPHKFVTASGMPESDMAKFRQLLSEAFGDPKIGDLLTNAFEKAFGSTLQSNIGMFSGATMPYGSTTLFGPQNAGADFMAWSQDQGIKATMSESSRSIDRLRQEQQINYLVASGAAQNAEQATAMSERFTFTGAASNFMFNQMQPGALQRGMEEASRYMGAAAIGYDPQGRDDRMESRMMATALTEDFLGGNIDKYYGLKGADVGRLYAEMGRTGQLSKIRNTSENESDMEARVIEATQEASRSIQAFRQIFRGSVTDVLDQVNAMMGVDVMATFDDQGRSLLQNMSSAGSITGFAPQQMAALGGMSRKVSMQAGLDPWGSAAVATQAAQILGTQRQGGHISPFVNQVDFRNDVVVKTTGAQQSGLSRDISGAYAMLAQRKDGSAEAFLTKIRNMSPEETMTLDPTTLARMVGEGTSGFDIRDASYTEEAEKARARGIGTLTASRYNSASINSGRLAMIRNRLENGGVEGIEGIMTELGSGAVTEDAMRKAFEGNAKAMSLRGGLMRSFELQADALNFSGGARGVDQMLGTSFDTDRMNGILNQTAAGRQMLEALGGENISGGITGINAYINSLGDPTKEGTMKGFVQAALGKGNDISADSARKMLGAFGKGTDRLQKYLDQDLSGDARGKQQLAGMGANMALKTIFSRQYKGAEASEEQLEEARKLLENFENDPQALMDYAERVGGNGYDTQVLKNSFSIAGDLKGKKGADGKKISDSKIKEAAKAVTLMEQVTAEKDFESAGLADEDTAKKFRSTNAQLLKAYQDNLKKDGATIDPEAFKKKWFESRKDSDMGMAEYDKLLDKEAKMNEDVGSPESLATGMGAIVGLLEKIMRWLETEGIGGSNEDGKGKG